MEELEKLKILHLALSISEIFDFMPDYEGIEEDDYSYFRNVEGVEFNEYNVKLACVSYSGFGIQSIRDEIVDLSISFLK
mgnify:FL=1